VRKGPGWHRGGQGPRRSRDRPGHRGRSRDRVARRRRGVPAGDVRAAHADPVRDPAPAPGLPRRRAAEVRRGPAQEPGEERDRRVGVLEAHMTRRTGPLAARWWAPALALACVAAGEARAQDSRYLIPSFIVSEFYDDNLFSTPGDVESDYITRLGVGLEAGHESTPLTVIGRASVAGE